MCRDSLVKRQGNICCFCIWSVAVSEFTLMDDKVAKILPSTNIGLKGFALNKNKSNAFAFENKRGRYSKFRYYSFLLSMNLLKVF